MPTGRSLLILPPGSRAGCKPMRAERSSASSTTASRHGSISAERLDVGELDAPIAGNVDLGHRPAPAVRLVVLHQSVGQRLARQHLQLGVERGAHRQPAFVELLFAVALIGFRGALPRRNIRRRRCARLSAFVRHAERRALGLLGVGRLDEAVGRHLVDHPVAPLDGALALAERMVIVRRLRQRREIGRFGMVSSFTDLSK